jgi:hypothetical protein
VLFAGQDVGAENCALLAYVVATCTLNDLGPVAYHPTLHAILNGHPQSRMEDAHALELPGALAKRFCFNRWWRSVCWLAQ